MGCLKLTYYNEKYFPIYRVQNKSELKISYRKKELTLEKSKKSLRSTLLFGLVMRGLSYVAPSLIDNGTQNKFLYNGKELQDDLGLMLYDYGNRSYDPVLGRFTTQDRFAEKYISMSPYQYGANNPVLFIDINGDSLSTNAWKWANKIISSVNSQQKSNNNKISSLNTKLKNGKIKQKSYDRKTKRLNEANSELEAARGEIATLAASSQMYDVKEQSGLTSANGTAAAGITSFNFSTNTVVMQFNSKSYGLGEIAHEFKHAFQFETGDLDFGEDGNPSMLTWDKFDEKNANTRSSYFGTATTTNPSGSNYPKSIAGYSKKQINNAYQDKLKKTLIKRQKHAYRTNNQTYIWKP